MATAPTLAEYDESTFSDTFATDELASSCSWQANDIILVFGMASDDRANATLATPTVTGLTFSLLTSINAGANTSTDTRLWLWSATAGSSGSGQIASVTGSPTGTLKCGIGVQVWRGSDGLGTPVTLDGSTAKTISVTTTQDNSCVAWAMGDWNQVGDVTVTATPSGTIRHASAETGEADFFIGNTNDLGVIGTYACGIASHTGTVDMSGIAVEVKGATSVGRTTHNVRTHPLGIRHGMGFRITGRK